MKKILSQKVKALFRKSGTLLKKSVCLLLSVTTFLGATAFTSSAGELKGDDSTSSTLEEMQSLVAASSYADYYAKYAGSQPAGLETYSIDVLGSLIGDGVIVKDSQACLESREDNPGAWANFGEENWDKSVYLPTVSSDGKQAGSASWHFTISAQQQGLYYLRIEYFNCQVDYTDTDLSDGDGSESSSVSAIQRKLLIDGQIPFKEVSSVTFDKHWFYDYDKPESVTTVITVGEVGTTVEYKTDSEGSHKIVTEIWRDGEELKQTVTTYTITQDINGNSMAPTAEEVSEWSTVTCSDASGYYRGYFCFYMSEGTHTLTLEAEREPMIIKSIELVPAYDSTEIPTYNEVLDSYDKAGYEAAEGGEVIRIEAEFPDFVSDSSVTSTNDNTSAVTYPISSSAQLFNVIGENGYNSVGQWAAYKFTVNKTGLYNLAMRFKQDALQGMYICRAIKIAGGDSSLGQYEYGVGGTPEVPFLEAYNAQFNYSQEWQSIYVGDEIFLDENGNKVNIADYSINKDGNYVDADGNVVNLTREKRDFKFYFEAGVEYTMYLECSLGTLGDYIQRVEASLNKINEYYLKILQRTGSDPDEYQDYKFYEIMPEVVVGLGTEAVELNNVKKGLEKLCGTNGSHIATLDTVIRILDIMGSERGDQIAANMANLKTYLGTLGTWINDSKRSTMMVDSIRIVSAGSDASVLPAANANFFESIWFEITSFIYSFFTEYDQMGLTEIPDENTTTIDVWLATGRDQSNIWRSMIDSDGGFTDQTGVAVTLKLVTAGTLLPSILSGRGPDVYLGLGSADVINYAIRNAVIPLSGDATAAEDPFANYIYEKADGTRVYISEEDIASADLSGLTWVSDSFKDVTESNFVKAAMDTMTLDKKSYGIPMTMSFAMMFYRMDVLAQLELEVPESWQQLLAILPVLQSNNMEIGVSYISALDFMIYQMGGSMWQYTDETMYNPADAGAKVALDSNVALEAFEFTCRLYTDYSFPVTFDTANRFRTGEMPIVIGDYASIYNNLVVFATEISGLWEFSSLPGSEKDGVYNYDSLAGISATVVLAGCKGEELLSAWRFAQWQTSADIQSNYGNSMVALIGPSAKYETANINAIKDLSWTAKEKAAIMNQIDNLSSIVNYPGSYIIARYMKFAFLDAFNDGASPYDAMMNYISDMNDEISRKREEFGLPTYKADEEPIKITPQTSK